MPTTQPGFEIGEQCLLYSGSFSSCGLKQVVRLVAPPPADVGCPEQWTFITNAGRDILARLFEEPPDAGRSGALRSC